MLPEPSWSSACIAFTTKRSKFRAYQRQAYDFVP
jgi:hypothetical protein